MAAYFKKFNDAKLIYILKQLVGLHLCIMFSDNAIPNHLIHSSSQGQTCVLSCLWSTNVKCSEIKKGLKGI
jgi:hypothetical protein